MKPHNEFIEDVKDATREIPIAERTKNGLYEDVPQKGDEQ